MKSPKPLELFPATEKGAKFSSQRLQRFALWRIWEPQKPKVMFIGLNPSTANENEDDPTIRRVVKMAFNWGFGGVYMLNCFSYISTRPNELEIYGTVTYNNDKWLKHYSELCDEIIFAWGAFDVVKDRGRDQELIKMFPGAKCLIQNVDGSPRHPLYVLGNTIPKPFKS